MSILKRIDDVLAKSVQYFCAVLFVSIIFLCFANTVARYCFNHPITWSEEVTKIMSVWLAIVGASMTAREDGHTTLDLLQEMIKNRTAKMILFVITRTIAVLSLVVLFPYSLELVEKLGNGRLSASHLPTWVLYAAFPVGSLCIILAYIRTVPGFAKMIRKGEKT